MSDRGDKARAVVDSVVGVEKARDQLLVTICARAGSKGVKNKNVREFLGKPLLVHAIDSAREWKPDVLILVSTDSAHYAKVAKDNGAEVPFLRPAELATDEVGKLPVLTHALLSAERHFNRTFSTVLDLDVSSPMRRLIDLENGYHSFLKSDAEVCYSVTPSRKNPYFNVVERDDSGNVRICKELNVFINSRQAAPRTFDINGSIYFYKASFLRSNPDSIFAGRMEIFEMPEDAAFDIDTETDFLVAESLMRARLLNEEQGFNSDG